MCFRPAEVNAPVECPQCGKRINYTNGVLPKKCPFCKTPMEELQAMAGADAVPARPPSPGAPTAPKNPGAPKAPSAPRS